MSQRGKSLPTAILAALLIYVPVGTEGMDVPGLRAAQVRLGIPENLAKVTDAQWDPEQSPLGLILIQDMHGFPQVQSRIAALIMQAYEGWGVKKVFVEGAFTPLDMTVFHRVPSKTKTLLLERLLKDGELSGPELAAVMIMDREWQNPPVSPFQTFGMEDPTLYRENVLAYRTVLARRQRALEEILAIRRLHASMNLPEGNPLSEQLTRVESLIRLKLTPAEYEAYRQTHGQTPASPALTPALQAAEEFYRLVHLRSRVFLTESCRKVPASTGPRVLVVGGFHTAAMADALRHSHIPFVVLSPAAPAEADAEPIYEKRLRKTASVLAQAIAPEE